MTNLNDIINQKAQELYPDFIPGIENSAAEPFRKGVEWATTDPLILQSLLQPFAEWIRGREGEQKMALNDHDWYWDSDRDGDAPITDEELSRQYIQFITDKQKEDGK